jgi:HD-like signal output (HDOD) protein/ActR/RegA family two-component response regulator
VRHILFVDDEEPILAGLRMRLHCMAHKWDMTFVESGAAALQALESKPFDVIVSDMRMPLMDGAELLRRVSERWPHVVRIVLSGYAQMQHTVRLVPVAHQYLSKPCSPMHLENVIDRCLQLQNLLQQPALRALVGRVRGIPAAPRTFTALQAVLARETVTAREVAQVVAVDPVIAAKFLQIVNSAFFRLPRRITNIEQAVAYLGFTAVRNLVMSAEAFATWKGTEQVLDIDHLQQHSQRVAAIAHALVARTDIADDTLLAALIHDIGYCLLAHECPRELQQAHATARTEHISLPEAETRIIGASHAEIGAYLLGIWGLPYTIVEAVANHHAPQRVSQTGFDVLAALATATALAEASDADLFPGGGLPDAKVAADYLQSIGAPFDWSEAERRAAECQA